MREWASRMSREASGPVPTPTLILFSHSRRYNFVYTASHLPFSPLSFLSCSHDPQPFVLGVAARGRPGARLLPAPREPRPAPRPGIDITGYKNIAQAIKATAKEFNFSSTTNSTPAGWLGVVVGEKNGKPVETNWRPSRQPKQPG